MSYIIAAVRCSRVRRINGRPGRLPADIYGPGRENEDLPTRCINNNIRARPAPPPVSIFDRTVGDSNYYYILLLLLLLLPSVKQVALLLFGRRAVGDATARNAPAPGHARRGRDYYNVFIFF